MFLNLVIAARDFAKVKTLASNETIIKEEKITTVGMRFGIFCFLLYFVMTKGQ